MTRRVFALGWLALAGSIRAATVDGLVAPQFKLAADAPEWRDLVAQFAARPDTLADFEEKRFFPFRNEPAVLRGQVRVSQAHGLSLAYREPEERTVILDAQGMRVREPAGRSAPPPDPRAQAGNDALRHILRFDFAALDAGYEVYGRRSGQAWALALVPRLRAVRNAIGDILVEGHGAVVERIELRRSARQHIDIAMSGSRTVTFTPGDVERFFK